MSELRQDPTSGDWAVIAPGRVSRPSFLTQKREPRVPAPKAACVFEHPDRTGNWPPIAIYPRTEEAAARQKAPKKWRILVVPNKYPVLDEHGASCSVPFRRGIFFGRTGVGRHELIITRDHAKNFAALAPRDAKDLFRVFQERCRDAARDRCLSYVVPFFNWGQKAGASVWHPHYQILALPVVPGHVAQSLAGARGYFKRHRRCVRCDIVKASRTDRARVVAENRFAVAVTPYASKTPFEVRIMPKAHFPQFRKTPAGVVGGVAELVQVAMRRLKARANDPDLNFFLHEAPIDGKPHVYHHWHAELLPRLTTPAGFEFSTGIYVNIISPENAAAVLRGEAEAEQDYH